MSKGYQQEEYMATFPSLRRHLEGFSSTSEEEEEDEEDDHHRCRYNPTKVDQDCNNISNGNGVEAWVTTRHSLDYKRKQQQQNQSRRLRITTKKRTLSLRTSVGQGEGIGRDYRNSTPTVRIVRPHRDRRQQLVGGSDSDGERKKHAVSVPRLRLRRSRKRQHATPVKAESSFLEHMHGNDDCDEDIISKRKCLDLSEIKQSAANPGKSSTTPLEKHLTGPPMIPSQQQTQPNQTTASTHECQDDRPLANASCAAATGTAGTTEITSNFHLQEAEQTAKISPDYGMEDNDESEKQDDSDEEVEQRDQQMTKSNADDVISKSRKRHPRPHISIPLRPSKQQKLARPTTYLEKTFTVDSNSPYLALIEGIESTEHLDEYAAHVMEKDCDCHPRIGRMMEFPSEAQSGTWTCRLPLDEHGGTGGGEKAPVPSADSVSLQGCRLMLRHKSHLFAGPLQRQMSDNIARINKDADEICKTHKEDSDRLSVSSMHPVLSRRSVVECQGTIALDQYPQSFIGSLSFVGYEGFTSTSDMHCHAADVTTGILDCVQRGPDRLLGIHGDIDATLISGVSTMCCLHIDSDYQIWIGQDSGLPNNPIVAIDVVFSKSNDLNSPQRRFSSVSDLQEYDDNVDPYQLTEQRLMSHSRSVGKSLPYDPFQRLWGTRTAAIAAAGINKMEHMIDHKEVAQDCLQLARPAEMRLSKPTSAAAATTNTRRTKPRIRIRMSRASTVNIGRAPSKVTVVLPKTEGDPDDNRPYATKVVTPCVEKSVPSSNEFDIDGNGIPIPLESQRDTGDQITMEGEKPPFRHVVSATPKAEAAELRAELVQLQPPSSDCAEVANQLAALANVKISPSSSSSTDSITPPPPGRSQAMQGPPISQTPQVATLDKYVNTKKEMINVRTPLPRTNRVGLLATVCSTFLLMTFPTCEMPGMHNTIRQEVSKRLSSTTASSPSHRLVFPPPTQEQEGWQQNIDGKDVDNSTNDNVEAEEDGDEDKHQQKRDNDGIASRFCPWC